MLSEIAITGFRCFPRAKAELRPLTVLLGQNDTGKSAFLAAIQHLCEARAPQAEDHWRHDRSLHPSIEGMTERGHISLAGGGDQAAGRASVTPLALYALPTGGPSLVGLGRSDDVGPPALDTLGEEVPAFLDYLVRRDRPRFEAFVASMVQRVAGLEDVKVGHPDAAHRRVDLQIDRGLVLGPDQVSVGVRLLLFFVALSYHPTPPRVVLVEEPENGVHPRRLADLVNLLRDLTRGVHNTHPAQVILTTHSPYLLDEVDPDEAQILVFRRNDDGSRTPEPVDRERLKTFLDEFMLGEVWYNQGEEGLIAKASTLA